jgi:hypothetical protein
VTISRDDVLEAIELLLRTKTPVLDEADHFIVKNWKRNSKYTKAGKIIEVLQVIDATPTFDVDFDPLEHQRRMMDEE